MNLVEVKKHLPTGAMKKIAQKTNITYPEVTLMFQGLQTKKTPILIKATEEYLQELKEATEKAEKALKGEITA